jgi:hypothetical protein
LHLQARVTALRQKSAFRQKRQDTLQTSVWTSPTSISKPLLIAEVYYRTVGLLLMSIGNTSPDKLKGNTAGRRCSMRPRSLPIGALISRRGKR